MGPRESRIQPKPSNQWPPPNASNIVKSTLHYIHNNGSGDQKMVSTSNKFGFRPGINRNCSPSNLLWTFGTSKWSIFSERPENNKGATVAEFEMKVFQSWLWKSTPNSQTYQRPDTLQHLKYRRTYYHQDTQTGQTPQQHDSTNLAQIGKSRTHFISELRNSRVQTAHSMNQNLFLVEIPVTKHSELLGSHDLVYIYF